MGCLLCGAPDLRDLYRKDGYAIRTCPSCGLGQLDPLPAVEVENSLYAEDYFESHDHGVGYSGYAEQEAEYLATFEEDVARIREFVPRGTLLEVGCGYGYFLRRAAAAGFDCYGIDRAGAAVEVAATHLPGRVFEGTLASVEALAGRRFDVIFASHLIEHVRDPRPFVAELAARLEKGGILALVTPNRRSLLARVSGRRWVSFKVPEHVAYYDPRTIRRLLRGAGLRTLAVDPACQHYRLPFLMSRVRELVDPLGRVVPRFEDLGFLRERVLRVTSGSLRAIATPEDPS